MTDEEYIEYGFPRDGREPRVERVLGAARMSREQFLTWLYSQKLIDVPTGYAVVVKTDTIMTGIRRLEVAQREKAAQSAQV